MYLSITLAFSVSTDRVAWEPLKLTLLGDKSFKNMSDQDWDLVIAVHLKGAYSCTKACWPLFRQQKVSYNYLKCSNKMTYFQKQFGRIVNTASAAGLYGNMGQANYSAAKSEILEIQPVSYQSFRFLTTIIIVGLIGFTRTLAREGAKYDIKVNVIAPVSRSSKHCTIR